MNCKFHPEEIDRPTMVERLYVTSHDSGMVINRLARTDPLDTNLSAAFTENQSSAARKKISGRIAMQVGKSAGMIVSIAGRKLLLSLCRILLPSRLR